MAAALERPLVAEMVKLHESCRTVARRAPLNVALGDPGHLHSCPKDSYFGQMLRELSLGEGRRMLADLGHVSAKV